MSLKISYSLNFDKKWKYISVSSMLVFLLMIFFSSEGMDLPTKIAVVGQNIEQTKSRTDKMSNRQNVDIFFFFSIFFSYNFSMPKNNVAGNSGMPLSANLLELESSILPRAKRASSETT